MTCPTAPVLDLRDRLRRAGLRPTRQRVSLMGVLFAKGHRHLTAEALHEEASQRGVRVSLATIYNTLHQFTDAGILREVAVDSAKTYFDTNTHNHHHMFVEGEHRILDIPAEAVQLDESPDIPDGFELVRMEVVLRVRRKQ